MVGVGEPQLVEGALVDLLTMLGARPESAGRTGAESASEAIPRAEWTAFRFNNDTFQDRSDNYLYVAGKLRTDVTVEQARSDMDAVGHT